jgi:hypothetical protein
MSDSLNVLASVKSKQRKVHRKSGRNTHFQVVVMDLQVQRHCSAPLKQRIAEKNEEEKRRRRSERMIGESEKSDAQQSSYRSDTIVKMAQKNL